MTTVPHQLTELAKDLLNGIGRPYRTTDHGACVYTIRDRSQHSVNTTPKYGNRYRYWVEIRCPENVLWIGMRCKQDAVRMISRLPDAFRWTPAPVRHVKVIDTKGWVKNQYDDGILYTGNVRLVQTY